MQILQWLFNMAAQEPPKIVTSIRKCDEDKKMKQKDTIGSVSDIHSHRGKRRQLKGVEESKLNCENLVLFRFLQRKDVSKPFFYQTLNLKGLGSFRHSRKTTRRSEEIDQGGVPQPPALGGNKVLPIALDSAHSDSDERDNYEAKGSKKKVVIRVKELLKWAATTKKFNKKAAASNVAVLEYDQFCDESPKISISWEMTTTTTTNTTSSTNSRASSTSRDDRIECGDSAAGIGNWITTDSEFVVLEL